MYIDLLRGTVVEVPSLESTTRQLPEADLYFWLGVMVVFDNAGHGDSEYYHATLLDPEHTTPTAFTPHLNPVYDDPTAIITTLSSPNPKSVPATSLLVNFVERGCSLDFEKTTPQPSPIPVTTPLAHATLFGPPDDPAAPPPGDPPGEPPGDLPGDQSAAPLLPLHHHPIPNPPWTSSSPR